MPPVLPRARGIRGYPQGSPMPMAGPQPGMPAPAMEPVDPFEMQRQELMKQLAALNDQQMYSPEEQQRRKQENDRDYNVGLAASLAGNEDVRGVGGQVLKQTMADRAHKVSDRGSFDPISGKWTISPEWKRDRIQAQLDKVDTNRTASLDRAAAREDNQQFRRDMVGAQAANRTEPLVAVIGPDGVTPTLVPRSQAAGMKPAPPATNAQPSEDERKAAGWLNQARLAYSNMQSAIKADPRAAEQTARELVVGAAPMVGPTLAYANNSPARQKFRTAASSLSEAVLRAATGAGVGKEEALQKVQELTPRFGEDATVIAMKNEMAQMYLQSLLQRAGRATPAAATSGPAAASHAPLGGADPADPFGWNKGKKP